MSTYTFTTNDAMSEELKQGPKPANPFRDVAKALVGEDGKPNGKSITFHAVDVESLEDKSRIARIKRDLTNAAKEYGLGASSRFFLAKVGKGASATDAVHCEFSFTATVFGRKPKDAEGKASA